MGKNILCFSETGDGWKNLALDEWFLDHVSEGDLVLYFYVNSNAVIIGKNQNPWKECNFAAMEKDGVQLVRRVSGGGAVYHDEGNLNFSFIAGKGRYDLEKQMTLILEAVRGAGIPCEFSGRNDLLADGRKFSGNAFCVRKENRLHHGTLLISSDLSRLAGYLQVDPRKIRSKGISSVRSRVCNLSEFQSGLTVEKMKKILPAAFRKVYGDYEIFSPTEEEKREIARYEEKQASWEWRVGATPKFDFEIDERFSFGGVQVCFSLEKGKIAGVKVYSDANDEGIASEIEARLAGLPFSAESCGSALAASENENLRELAAFILTQNF